ncbi:hypothetical protein ASD19_06675 [Microbacterium sp. Root53]|uniref:VanZ family protein n=1 Tax=Microbacterium sp. Root53 TaxID=1736553 RepID=UPI0006F23D1E|nr:VanZ family protein [Microbacterium sp. Root53]KQY98519.1 hypothetical protein ASD19_06675 [Microbacterium sp. Root53]
MTDVLGPKPPRSHARMWVTTLLLLVYAGFVSLVTLWPDPSDLEFGSIAERVLRVLHRFGVPEWFGFNELEFAANVAMFVPLGFLLGLALPRRAWWLALFLLPGYSGFIEFTQATVLESRVSTLLDVFANTSGGYIGLLLAMILRAMIHARDRRMIARAIWERDAELIAARRRPVPPGLAEPWDDPADRIFGAPRARTADDVPTMQLPIER